ERFLPLARALDASSLLSFRSADPALALQNVKTGLKNVLPRHAEVKLHLPRIDTSELVSLEELALATRYAAIEASLSHPGQSDVLAKLVAARRVRGALLAVAEGLAATGHLPARDVEAIKRGRGAQDTAADCVAL